MLPAAARQAKIKRQQKGTAIPGAARSQFGQSFPANPRIAPRRDRDSESWPATCENIGAEPNPATTWMQ
jgi:hypothetical protein